MAFNFLADIFPYTDFNKINLDWIFDCLKGLTGGSTGQYLKKKSDADFDFEWASSGGGGGTSDYNDLTNKPQINGNTLSGNKTSSQLGITAADVGAMGAVTGTTAGQVLTWTGSAWAAQALPVYNGGVG